MYRVTGLLQNTNELYMHQVIGHNAYILLSLWFNFINLPKQKYGMKFNINPLPQSDIDLDEFTYKHSPEAHNKRQTTSVTV